jgi:glycosyltransferase involved in cell wall biosynthesis
MRPTFSFLIPTHREDRPLQRCLDSVASQLGKYDEVIVIGDTLDGQMPKVETLVRSYDRRFRYLTYNAGRHDWGHSQLNHGLEHAQGDYIHCNDDDDTWSPGAVALMREAMRGTPDRPLLFRFQSYFGPVYWQQRGLFARNHIGGHCLVAPNIPGKVGRFAPEYAGDFDYLESTINLHGGIEQAVWCDEVVCVARPSGVLVSA